jgi:hypothetical protein
MSAYGRLLSVVQLELDAIECPQQAKADHQLVSRSNIVSTNQRRLLQRVCVFTKP